VSKQSIEIVDDLRKQLAVAAQDDSVRPIETTTGKSQYEDGLTIKMKPITNQLDVDTNHLSNNFLFIYNSVTSVLRDRGII